MEFGITITRDKDFADVVKNNKRKSKTFSSENI
jgi:hypothetical protein